MLKKKILLTGGSGFIGRNILEQLGGKYDFFAPGHTELNLTDPRAVSAYLDANKFDVVIHAANVGGKRGAQHIKDVFETNQKMFLNLAENKQSYGQMIFLGSGAEYGKQADITNVTESDFGRVKPTDEYGRAKYFASEYIASAKNILNLRLFGVYGKYEDYSIRFISNAICRALAGLPIVIVQNTIFNYIYIQDLAVIISRFIEQEPKEKFYNVSSGVAIELLALAKIIQAATGDNAEIKIKNPGMGKSYTCNNFLLLQELPDFTFTSFEQSVSEMVAWYKTNWDKIDMHKLNFDA